MYYISFCYGKNRERGNGFATANIEGKMTLKKLNQIRESIKKDNGYDECLIMFFSEIERDDEDVEM